MDASHDRSRTTGACLFTSGMGLCFAMLISACATHPPSIASFTNSLGMKFVPVQVTGSSQHVEFCIHETRECDLATFRHTVSANPQRAATFVSWHEAREFCKWLTQRERATGQLRSDQSYRLPTDHEWSCAASIGSRENPHATPEHKRHLITNQYPWGSTWPPRRGDGNFFGEESRHTDDEHPVPGLHDGQRSLCNVMSYRPNALHLYDLGGNVWEWCEDEFRPGTNWRVLRGAAWNCSRPEVLLSSHRTFDPPEYRSDTVGFRVVRVSQQ